MRFSKPAIVIITLILTAVFGASIVYAQDSGPQIPPTAVNALGLVATMVAAFGGIIASQLTDIIRNLTGLKDEEKAQLSELVSPFIVGLLSVGAGIGFDRLLPAAGYLDDTGLWRLVVVFGPLVFAEIRHRWRSSGTEVTFEPIEPLPPEIKTRELR